MAWAILYGIRGLMLPFQRLKSECFEPQIRLAFILGLGLTYETHFFVLRTHLLVSWREELLCSRNPSFVSKKTISMETFLGSKNPSLCFMEGRVVSKELCSRNPSFVSKKTISMETSLGSWEPTSGSKEPGSMETTFGSMETTFGSKGTFLYFKGTNVLPKKSLMTTC